MSWKRELKDQKQREIEHLKLDIEAAARRG